MLNKYIFSHHHIFRNILELHAELTDTHKFVLFFNKMLNEELDPQNYCCLPQHIKQNVKCPVLLAYICICYSAYTVHSTL